MEKDIDKIAKNENTDIVIRIDDFGGKLGLTIREFAKSERYTGFTKSGIRIPADKFKVFKQAINSINEKELASELTNELGKESGIKQKEIEQTVDNSENVGIAPKKKDKKRKGKEIDEMTM